MSMLMYDVACRSDSLQRLTPVITGTKQWGNFARTALREAISPPKLLIKQRGKEFFESFLYTKYLQRESPPKPDVDIFTTDILRFNTTRPKMSMDLDDAPVSIAPVGMQQNTAT